jgi:HSP20 family protein
MALPARVYRHVDPFEAIHREMDSMLGRFLGGQEQSNWMAPYAVDIREDADHIYVDAELPGFKKDEVEVSLENQTLTISAERKSQRKEGNGGQMLLQERTYHRFLRSFTLPPTVNEQKVDAKLNEGVLSIVLDKREETKPRKITVN